MYNEYSRKVVELKEQIIDSIKTSASNLLNGIQHTHSIILQDNVYINTDLSYDARIISVDINYYDEVVITDTDGEVYLISHDYEYLPLETFAELADCLLTKNGYQIEEKEEQSL